MAVLCLVWLFMHHTTEAAADPAAGASSRFEPSSRSEPLRELRAVKITNVDSNVLYSDEAIAEAMDYLASIGINAVLPVVQNAGYTQYPSEVMDRYFGRPIDPRMAGRDPLAVLIREARRAGIEVYPWFEYGFAVHYSGNNEPTGGFIGQQYPDWLSRHRDNSICKKNGFEWMSGINPDVQKFMLELVMEVVRNYDIDGIEFSDRMPALPRECGYDEATVEVYKSEHNGSSPTTVYRNTFWMRWRADKLNDFYRTVRDSVLAWDPALQIASSPNIYPWGYVEYLQDPVTWASEGIVDHLIPQLYRYNISDYVFELNKTLKDIPAAKRHIYFAGILMNVGSYVISKEFLGKSIEANREAGVAGEAFFFYEGLRRNGNELGDFLAERYYSEPAEVPRTVRGTSAEEEGHRQNGPDEHPFDVIVASSYPNPFNASTVVSVQIPESSEAVITVYDIMGRRVEELFMGHLVEGRHEFHWNATGMATGIYITAIRTHRYSETILVTLLR